MGAGPGGTHTAVAPTIGHEAAPVAPSPKREKPGEAWFYSSSPSSSQGGGGCAWWSLPRLPPTLLSEVYRIAFQVPWE